MQIFPATAWAQSIPTPTAPTCTPTTTWSPPANTVTLTDMGTIAACAGMDGVVVPYTGTCLTDIHALGAAVEAAALSAYNTNTATTITIPHGAIFEPTATANCLHDAGAGNQTSCHLYLPYNANWDGTKSLYIISDSMSHIPTPGAGRVHPIRISIKSIAVTSNVVSLIYQARPEVGFNQGETAFLSGLTTSTFLNGQQVTVTADSCQNALGLTGLCTVTFPFTHANQSTTTDTGIIQSNDAYYMAHMITDDANPALLWNGGTHTSIGGIEADSVSSVGCGSSSPCYPYAKGYSYQIIRSIGPGFYGARTATVVTPDHGSETAQLGKAFTILFANKPYIVNTSPNYEPAGATNVNVLLPALNSHFVDGTSVATFTDVNNGYIITVNSTHVNTADCIAAGYASGLCAEANISVPAGSSGAANIVVRTGTETAVSFHPFIFGSQVASVTCSSSPCNIPPNTSGATISLTGSGGTNWTSAFRLYLQNPTNICLGTYVSGACVTSAPTVTSTNTLTQTISTSSAPWPINHRIRVANPSAGSGSNGTGAESDWLDAAIGTVPIPNGARVAFVTPDWGVRGTTQHVMVYVPGGHADSTTTFDLCGGPSFCPGWPDNGVTIANLAVNTSGCLALYPAGQCFEADATIGATAESNSGYNQIQSSWIHAHDGDYTDPSTGQGCTTATTNCTITNAVNVVEGVQWDSHHSAIMDSWLSQLHQDGNLAQDSQAIQANYTSCNEVHNSYVDSIGECMLIGGATSQTGSPYRVDNYTVTQNLFDKATLYALPHIALTPGPIKYFFKDELEWKTGNQVNASGNVFRNSFLGPLSYGWAVIIGTRTGQNQGSIATTDDDINVYNNYFTNVSGAGSVFYSDDTNCTPFTTDPTCIYRGEDYRVTGYNNLVNLISASALGGRSPSSAWLLNLGNTNTGNAGIHDTVIEHNTEAMNFGLTENCGQDVQWNMGGATNPVAFGPASTNLWIIDNANCSQPLGAWGQVGYNGLTKYMGNPSSDLSGTNPSRYQGNAMYSAGATCQTWTPTNSACYTSAFTFTNAGAGNYQLVTPNTTSLTTDGVQGGVVMSTLTPLIAAALTGISSPTLSVVTTSLPPAVNGVAYSTPLMAIGGTTPYTWSLHSGSLPTGMSLSSGGVISGTCTSNGTYTFVVQVTDSSTPTPQTALSVNLSITVNPPPLQITTTSLPAGTVSFAYGPITMAATGGVPPYSWSVSFHTLPPGLTIGPSSGVISGTPTLTGVYTFLIQVQDSVGSVSPYPYGVQIFPVMQLNPVILNGNANLTGDASAH